MPQLIAPTKSLRASWQLAHVEWGPGAHEDGFGLTSADDVHTPEGYDRWVSRLLEDTGTTYRWIVEGDTVFGGIALRHNFDDHASSVGHIGFGIRPNARRQGHATWALGAILDHARLVGLSRVRLVCAEDNIASARTIEQSGGTLTEVRATEHGPAWHYWIDLARS